jgi:hypothetical protein
MDQGSAPRSLAATTLESAYAYDAMIQNSDREPDLRIPIWTCLGWRRIFRFLTDASRR